MFATFDRECHFDASKEVALHPVGTGAIQLDVPIIEEIIDTRMFEESADDRTHTDVVRYAGNARPQCADAAYDKVDLYAGLRGFIQRLDDLRFDQRIEFGDDPCWIALPCMVRFPCDF